MVVIRSFTYLSSSPFSVSSSSSEGRKPDRNTPPHDSHASVSSNSSSGLSTTVNPSLDSPSSKHESWYRSPDLSLRHTLMPAIGSPPTFGCLLHAPAWRESSNGHPHRPVYRLLLLDG